MNWSFEILRVRGISLRVHITFFIIVILSAVQWADLGGGVSGALFGVVLILLLILGSMASALVFLIKDGGKTRRSVRALTVRISLSLALFLLLLFGYYMGWFVPNQRPF